VAPGQVVQLDAAVEHIGDESPAWGWWSWSGPLPSLPQVRTNTPSGVKHWTR
jgi:hypothetical protein